MPDEENMHPPKTIVDFDCWREMEVHLIWTGLQQGGFQETKVVLHQETNGSKVDIVSVWKLFHIVFVLTQLRQSGLAKCSSFVLELHESFFYIDWTRLLSTQEIQWRYLIPALVGRTPVCGWFYERPWVTLKIMRKVDSWTT